MLVVVAAAAALAACGKSQPEGGKPQPENRTTQMADKPAYDGAKAPHVAAGWQPGDPRSWEEQMRRRVQNQNEHVRISRNK